MAVVEDARVVAVLLGGGMTCGVRSSAKRSRERVSWRSGPPVGCRAVEMVLVRLTPGPACQREQARQRRRWATQWEKRDG
jgi:hypothetical protein